MTLDEARDNLAVPRQVILNPGESLKFESTNGDFAIFIPNAIDFLEVSEVDLKLLVTNSNPESDEYPVLDIDESINIEYVIYSIGNDEWPDAPPRIIIRVQ